MPEPPLVPQSIHRGPEEIAAQVERADYERGGAEEPRSVGVEPLLRRLPAQARQNALRVTCRIRIRVDCEYAWVCGIGVSQLAGGLDQELSGFGTRIDPPG